MSKSENITPERLRCVAMASCPSIHRLADGRLLIVGRTAWSISCEDDQAEEAYSALLIAGKIGKDETAIIIPPELLDTLKAEWIREFLDEKATTGRELLIALSQSTKR